MHWFISGRRIWGIYYFPWAVYFFFFKPHKGQNHLCASLSCLENVFLYLFCVYCFGCIWVISEFSCSFRMWVCAGWLYSLLTAPPPTSGTHQGDVCLGEKARKSNNRDGKYAWRQAGERVEEGLWKKSERPAFGVESSCSAYCFLTNLLKSFIKVLNPFSTYVFRFCLFLLKST